MDFITWTATGLKLYIGDTTVISLTYDELMIYLVVLGVCVGLIIGLILSYTTRIAAHRIVKALVSEGCNTPETAVTVDSLSVRGKWQIKRMLRTGKVLRRTVLCANEAEMQEKAPGKLKKFWFTKFLGQEIPMKTDLSVARFYIPEENRIAAETRYSREGMSPVALVITIVVLVGVAVGAMFAIPELITMTENVFGGESK